MNNEEIRKEENQMDVTVVNLVKNKDSVIKGAKITVTKDDIRKVISSLPDSTELSQEEIAARKALNNFLKN